MRLKQLAKHIGYFFIVLSILFLLVALPSIIPHTLTSTEKQNYIDANIQRQQTITPITIFLNNFLIAGFAIFPFAGWLFVGLVTFKTGLVVASYNEPATWILTSFFGVVELSVYSFCIVQSIRIFGFYRQRKTLRFWHSTAKTVVLTLSIAGLILLVSAIIEYVVILRNVII